MSARDESRADELLGLAEERPLVRNAGDPEQVADGKRREKHRQRDELADLRAVLALPEGRRVLRRVLDQTRLWAPVMGETNDVTNFNAGQQAIGAWLIRAIQAADAEAATAILLNRLREPASATPERPDA